MQRILFPVSVFTLEFQFQAIFCFPAGQDFIKQRQQAAVIHICMGNKDLLFHPVIFRDQATEQFLHFLTVKRVSTINKQGVATTPQDCGVASAGRLNQNDFRAFCDLVPGNPGKKSIAAACGKKFREPADAFKRFKR